MGPERDGPHVARLEQELIAALRAAAAALRADPVLAFPAPPTRPGARRPVRRVRWRRRI
jgi:hypothetical protein